MDLRDSLCRFYYDSTVSDLRQVNKTGGGELSYNSIMYLDVISYQQALGVCTVTTLADTLHISRAAATIKVGELVKLGLVTKTRGRAGRRLADHHQYAASRLRLRRLSAVEHSRGRAASGGGRLLPG